MLDYHALAFLGQTKGIRFLGLENNKQIYSRLADEGKPVCSDLRHSLWQRRQPLIDFFSHFFRIILFVVMIAIS